MQDSSQSIISDALVNHILALVRSASRRILLPSFGKTLIQRRKSASVLDIVTELDIELQATLINGIQNLMPGSLIIAEENDTRLSADGFKNGQWTVVIDPIDGSWNFANSIPVFGVILSVLFGTYSVLGLLYDPMRDDWVIARRGRGCRTSQGRRIPSVSTSGPFRTDAMIGIVPVALFSRKHQHRLAEACSGFGHVMALGSCCHEHRLLAQGHADFMLTETVTPWDNIAGVLAMHEVGGIARMLDGRDYHPAMREGHLLLARSEEQFSMLQDILSGCLARADLLK